MSRKKGWFRKLMETPVIYWEYTPQKDNYVCKACSYGWTSKKKFGAPAFCPRCRSNLIIKVDR